MTPRRRVDRLEVPREVSGSRAGLSALTYSSGGFKPARTRSADDLPVRLGVVASVFGRIAGFRPGFSPGPPFFKTLGRGAFVLLVALAFILTGKQGGVAVCIGGGLVGLLAPFVLGRIFVPPVPEAPRASVTPRASATGLQPVLPALGRPSILKDMVQNGISRAKVWRLLYHGKLVAFEDPNDGKVTLVRPEDMEAFRRIETDLMGDDRP